MDLSYQQQSEESKLNDEELQKTCERYEDVLRQETMGGHVQYQGFWFPPTNHLKGVMLIQDHFRPRDDDIILATFPKCGTTWIRALAFAIMNRLSYDFESHPLLEKSPQELIPFTDTQVVEENSYPPLETLVSPRTLCTHMPYNLFPDCIKNSGCPFVYITRDPKDVFASMWHFTNKWRPLHLDGKRWSPEDYPLEYSFESFCSGISGYGPFWDHALGYWKASLERPDRVLFLTYEDLKRNTALQVKKMAEFLGVPFTMEEEKGDVVQQIVKLCSFENLSNLQVNKSSTKSNQDVHNSLFFRKGDSGDGKNLLTPAMVARIDKITMDKFAGSGLEMLKL